MADILPQIDEQQAVQKVKVKLLPARTSEEKRRNIIANIIVEGHTTSLLPYIDEAVTATNVSDLQTLNLRDKPRPRFYAVGRSTYKIRCPLCQKQADATKLGVGCMGEERCYLSALSCVFPLFWLCCICNWCGCDREWTTKALYCGNCGGKLGVQKKKA